jgi:hypothetical protein
VGHLLKRSKVIGRENLSLDNGEVDFDLVEPTGVNGQMHQMNVGIGGLESFNGGGSAMRRSVVDNPEDSGGAPIRLLLHDLLDQSAKGFEARRTSQAAKYAKAPPRSYSNSTRIVSLGCGGRVG